MPTLQLYSLLRDVRGAELAYTPIEGSPIRLLDANLDPILEITVAESGDLEVRACGSEPAVILVQPVVSNVIRISTKPPGE